MNFALEEIYNCTREEFCEQTDTQMSEMAARLIKEVAMLDNSLDFHRCNYRNGGRSTLDEQKQREKLIYAIERKLQHKREKIKDIQKYLKEVNCD